MGVVGAHVAQHAYTSYSHIKPSSLVCKVPTATGELKESSHRGRVERARRRDDDASCPWGSLQQEKEGRQREREKGLDALLLLAADDGELKVHVLAGQAAVHGRERVELVLERGRVL